MRIAILQDDYPPRHLGGAGAVAHTLAKEYRRLGHEVLVITAARKSERYEVDGIEVEALETWHHPAVRAWVSLYNPPVIKEIRRLLAEFEPDMVHVHNVHTHLSYASLRVAKKSGARVVVTLHDAMSYAHGKVPDARTLFAWEQFKKYRHYYNPLRNFFIRRALRRVNRRVAVSHALKEALEHNGIGDIEVVHNGINVDEWCSRPEAVTQFRSKHDLIDKKSIFFGGRIGKEKGGEQAVRMLARVPDAVLLVAGKEDIYAERMRSLARELGVLERLRFLGWLSGEALRAAYGASELVLVPSLYLDPLPTVVLEAMASRRAAVATERGGAAEMVVHGTTGYIVDPFDIERLSRCVADLLQNPTKAAQFGDAGYKRVKMHFDLASQAAQYLR